LKSAGRADVAMVLRGGSNSELNSGLLRDQTITIKQAPGVKKDDDGEPLAAAESDRDRRIGAQGRRQERRQHHRARRAGESMKLRPQLHIVEGRMFETGKRELVVGRGVTRQFSGAAVGETLRMRGSDWTVVGIFESGDANESEIVGRRGSGAEHVQSPGFSSVRAVLETQESLDGFKSALARRSAPRRGRDQ
jgi:putative ABC transport system permease protein